MYPPIDKRAQYMVRAAGEMGFRQIPNYAVHFTETAYVTSQNSEQFLVRASDEATENMVERLIRAADNFVQAAGIDKPSDASATAIAQAFKHIVPANTPPTLANIVNAGWS